MGNYTFRNPTNKNSPTETPAPIPEFPFGVQDMIKVKKRGLSNNYYICHLPLGSGSYGKVYKAIHLQTKVVRAIKKIPTALLGNEFCILKQLDHPNVLKIYEMYYQGEFSYIVTEFYEGGSLADLISKYSCLNETTALKYMFQILSGVNYLHSKNIIHGDLKPQNILLDETRQKVYLADFGLSTYQSSDQCKPTGTKQFMAPDGSRLFCQKKFDMWACGVIMYLLLAGDLPPQIQKLPQDLRRAKWANISSEAKDLLSKLLQIDPQGRITAREALFHNWFLQIHQEFYTGSIEWLRKMVENMLQNSHKNSLQRLVLFYIANFVLSKEKRRSFQYFVAFDRNLDGVITKEEMSIIFEKLKIHEDIDKLFNIIDSNNSGKIDYAEFLTFGAGSDKLLSEEALHKAFEWLDQNSDNKISRQELQLCLNGQIPCGAIEEIMNYCDKNKNGFIEYDEFLKFIQA